MLFNKTNNGTQELKELLGFLYSSTNFANIKTDLILAHEDIQKIIGKGVMDVAVHRYNSELFLSGDDPLRDELVKHIQLPIAYYAHASFSAHTDLTHGEDGRKVSIDNENQKLAWEWMIERDDEATINKAHKTTDRLLNFLETNSKSFPHWAYSPERKAANSLFLPNANSVNEIFPIDNSRRFFILIIPFIKEAERKYILPVLKKDVFDDLKAKGSDSPYASLLPFIQVPLVFFSLSLAISRLSITMLPNGIFQDFSSIKPTTKSKHVIDFDIRKSISSIFYKDARFELDSLEKEYAKLSAEILSTPYTPVSPAAYINPRSKIFSL